MKIAIYSGSIPSTTFVENLIEGVSINHDVYLFGTVNASKSYPSRNIKIFNIPKSLFFNLVITKWRLFLLLISQPKRILIALNETKKYQGLYAKWVVFSRCIPVLLNLPDIFHIQWAKDLNRWMFLKEKLGVKLILSLRGAHINYSPIVNKKLAISYKENFPKIDAFHSVSHSMANEAQKYNLDINKVEVIYSPVPEIVFSKFSKYRRSNKNEMRICTIGRFHWIKGMKYFFMALYELKAKNIPFKHICVSSNSISEEAIFQIDQLGLNEFIEFKERLDQKHLFELMKTCDVLVLPSLNEGIANVVLEAMAIGLPVISTNCGGMAEVVIPKKTGWLVPIRNPQAITNAIINVMKTPENEVIKITENAYHFVKEHFNAKKSIKKFIELYNSVM